MARANARRIHTRNGQPTTRGLGVHFASPMKRRDKRKSSTIIHIPGHHFKCQALLGDIQTLMHQTSQLPPPKDAIDESMLMDTTVDESTLMDTTVDDTVTTGETIECDQAPPSVRRDTGKRRLLPDDEAYLLYDRWKSILPSLVDPLLSYDKASMGRVFQPTSDILCSCSSFACSKKAIPITTLYFDHFETATVTVCSCYSTTEALVLHGLFPTAPSQSRVAISILLLDFYRALFERSCDAVHALSNALHSFYKRRGFHVKDKKGEEVRDPFRRGIGHAIQWYDSLRVAVERRVDAMVEAARLRIREDASRNSPTVSNPLPSSTISLSDAPYQSASPAPTQSSSSPLSALAQNQRSPTSSSATGMSKQQSAMTMSEGRCAQVLQSRCPACFGGARFGTPLERGGDIHCTTDGNFHHRHSRAAGDSPHFYDPTYFISKKQVDDVGKRIDHQRHKPPRHYTLKVPSEAVDECEKAHEAADGKKQKTAMDQFDDTGLMALVCRHDIPLFFANIDTPGEQQKYALALLEHLFEFLPPQATIYLLYDVGCVVDRSVHLYDILPSTIVDWVAFATTAMHAYAHQWACQLAYNPRLLQGLGLTDGEGVERLWSHCCKLIGITRRSARSRRIWLIDRQAAAIGSDLRDDLGDWVQRRMTSGVIGQGQVAQSTLNDCKVPVTELRCQWEHQKQTQLSIRAHAPARLKRELDAVLNLQADLDVISSAIHMAKSQLQASQESIHVIKSLESTHTTLVEKVEELYSSLNVHHSFPELKGIDLEFIRTLLLARDLKINIRKRAIGSFFEWERLDQAVGGQNQALGTKLHQRTRKAITKRKPALMTAIRKFNKYCATLQSLHRPEWSIPLPQPLPTKLSTLRDSGSLLEDVWVTPANGNIPRWLEDPDVRRGIRAMLKVDRCLEERRRLGSEVDNLCRWFGNELASIELALCTPENELLFLHLRNRRDRLLLLKRHWARPLGSSIRFDSQVANAIETARHLSGIPFTRPFTWISATIPERFFTLPDDMISEDSVPEDGIDVDADLDSGQTVLSDIIAADNDLESGQMDGTEMGQMDDVEIVWDLPDQIQSDPFEEVLRFESRSNTPLFNTNWICPRQAGIARFIFERRDVDILSSPTALLNDVCLNGGAAVLYRYISSLDPTRTDHCAILSTFDLVRIRGDVSDERLWRHIRLTLYWLKSIWILPIHRTQPAGHWVLAIIHTTTQTIHLFDSLASRQAWPDDVEDIMRLITKMVNLANKHGKILYIRTEGWKACPLLTRPLQSNSHDCGLWVLSTITAVLRGFQTTGLDESQMLNFRTFLRSLVLGLPHD